VSGSPRRDAPAKDLAVVHTIARLASAEGGPARSVAALCRALAEEGAKVEIVTGEAELDPGVPARASGIARRWGRLQPRRGPFARLLEARLAATDAALVHDHGIWLASNRAAARAAARHSVARIVSPRGMLSEWSLTHRGRRKRIAWRGYQKRDLESAAALHATSDLEAEEIRAAGIGVPIAVVPNGVDLPPIGGRDPGPAERTRRLLFLSRIHPKKGLETLVEAWGAARPAGWELVIAGPDERGHRAEIERRARAVEAGAAIRFRDAVPDAEKWDLYGTADVFVLPTSSENFGAVVAEALASGVPVITTRAAPWSALVESGCGWWTEAGVQPLAEAIREAAALPDDRRRAMGERGRRLVAERFAWPAIARRMLEVYRWLAGQGDAPGCVRKD
jgi:glycosyltransferase involved in cell wall biosynthesis